jgi:hypothetical protein
VSYLSEVLADSPLHYWRLADPAGAAVNDIGSGLPSLLIPEIGGAGAHSYGNQLGYSGPVSDGGSALLTGCAYRGPSFSFSTPCSFECWVWMVVAGSRYLVFGAGNGTNEHGISIETDQKAEIYGLTPSANPAGGSVGENGWHHLVATTDETTGIIYIDGASVATHSADHRTTSNARFKIGGDPNSTNAGGLIGAIAECAFYTAALTATRVGVHFAAADLVLQPPVAGNSGGLGGTSSVARNALYTDALDAILASVRSTYRNAA